jgi:hypothetical protein
MGSERRRTDVQMRFARAHHALLRRAEADATHQSPASVLDLGAAVLFHGALEEQWPAALNSALDESAIGQLANEHERLADDLELLQSIWEATPESPDLDPLCQALRKRLKAHLARDDRIFYLSIPKLQTAHPISDRSR